MSALDLLWPFLLALVNSWAGYRIGRHHLDEVERQAWNDGYDAACLQMLQGLVDADPDDDSDGPLAGMVRGLHDRDLDDALAPPAGYDPEMN